MKSSDNRLESCQKYIFNCIFDLFGDDMKKVFLAMLTFCDGGKPQVISALTDENCLFSQFLFSIGKDWYYKFNNSAIFEKNEEDILNLTYWNIGMNSFKNFTEKINTLPAINLDKTRRVLEIRSLLVSTIEILSYKLREGLNKIDELKGIYKIIQNLKGEDINDSRNYTQTQKVTREKEVPVASGVYMTTCLRCSETCHRNCQISDDDYKDGCGAMNWKTEPNKAKRHCLYCKNKCHWQMHKNRPYEIVQYTENKVITLDYIKNKYFDSKKKLENKSDMLKQIKNHLINLNIECMETQENLTKNINELQSIALNKSAFNSVEEHIDELILTEKSEHKDGWQERVKGYLILKKQKENYRKICEGKLEDLKTMSKFIMESFKDDKALDEFISNENKNEKKKMIEKSENACLIF